MSDDVTEILPVDLEEVPVQPDEAPAEFDCEANEPQDQEATSA